MKLKKNIAASESGFVFNPTTGDSYSTNPIGAEILSLMKEGKSFAEISSTILEKYEVDAAVFEKDYMDFAAQLKGYNLLEQ